MVCGLTGKSGTLAAQPAILESNRDKENVQIHLQILVVILALAQVLIPKNVAFNHVLAVCFSYYLTIKFHLTKFHFLFSKHHWDIVRNNKHWHCYNALNFSSGSRGLTTYRQTESHGFLYWSLNGDQRSSINLRDYTLPISVTSLTCYHLSNSWDHLVKVLIFQGNSLNSMRGNV